MDGCLLIRGRKFAELSDGGGDYAQREIDVGGSGVAAEAEAQAGAGFLRGQADGGKHMRRLDGAGGASGASGTRETLQVESNEEGFAFDTGENKIGRVGRARRSASVYARMRNELEQALLQLVAERGDATGIFRERLARHFRGLGESHDAGDIFRAGAETALVMAAIEKLAQTRSTADIERADSLGRIQFVAGNRKQIHLERVDVDGNFSGGLHGVGMEVDVGFFSDAADFFERLDGAKLVIGVHDGDENCFRTNAAAQLAEVNQLFAIRRQWGKARVSLFERWAGF